MDAFQYTSVTYMTRESIEQACAISNIFQQIDKTLRAYRTYEEGHPILLEFEKKLLDHFSDFLGQAGSFSVEVSPYQYLYGDEIVYENADKKDNFSFKFHQDGVRQFTFLEGLTLEEVKYFLSVIRTNFQSNEHADDDTVTLLWKAGMQHINHMVVETFIYQGEETVDTEKAILEAAAPFIRDTAPPSIDIDSLGHQEQGSRNLRPSDLEEMKSLPNIELDYHYSESENQNTVQTEISQDDDVVIKRILLLLLRMLLGIGDDQDFLSTATVVQRIIESMVRTKQYGLVAKVLAKIEDLSDPLKNPDPRKAALLHNLRSGLVGPHLLEIVSKNVKSLSRDQIKELGELSLRLPTTCLDLLFDIFRNEDNPALRAELIPVLALHGHEKLAMFSSAISGADTELALFLLDIFARIGLDRTVLQIKKSFRHADAKVRAKVLDLLFQESSDHAKSISLMGIKDTDQSIRMRSLNFLVSLKDAKLATPILEAVREDAFESKKRDEKIAFYIALSRLAGKASFNFFIDELDRGVLGRSDKDVDRQISSIWALKELGTKEAKAAVEKLENKKLSPKQVREVCLKALQIWPKE